MLKVAVPSLRNKTRKSRTAASRAVVSQQTLVAIPVMIKGVYPAGAQNQFQVSTMKRAKPWLIEENVSYVHDEILVESGRRRALVENARFNNRVELSEDAKV